MIHLLGAYVVGFEAGSADFACAACGTTLTVSAVPGDGESVVSMFDCDCGGAASLRSVVWR